MLSNRPMHPRHDRLPALKTLDQAAALVHVTPSRLRALAESGHAPHWTIDGGDPLFHMPTLKTWVSNNLVRSTRGRKLPSEIRLYVGTDSVPDPSRIPRSLSAIPGLLDITSAATYCGIYFLCRARRVVYVGQSVNAAGRIGSYPMERYDCALFMPCPRDCLDHLERAFIRALKPVENRTAPSISLPAPQAAALQTWADNIVGVV